MVNSFLCFIMLILPVLISVAFLTLLERKLLSLVGLRVGPNKVSAGGFLQPIGDAVKLSNKQAVNLSNFSYMFYYLSSFLMIFSSLYLWISSFNGYYKFFFLIVMLILSLNSLNSILSGWSSFCKYSLIGSLRTVAQLISYEASLYFCIFFFVFFFLSFSFNSFYSYMIIPSFLLIPVVFYIWMPSFLAELNRTPYDFSEGESELVSGFNTEFGSDCFTLIFLSEYSSILFFSFLTSMLFLFPSFHLFFLICYFIIWIRSVVPRFRFDKLMMLAWKFLIPFISIFFLSFFIFVFLL